MIPIRGWLAMFLSVAGTRASIEPPMPNNPRRAFGTRTMISSPFCATSASAIQALVARLAQ